MQPGLEDEDVEKEVAEKKDDGNQGSRTECSLGHFFISRTPSRPWRRKALYWGAPENEKWQKNHAKQQDFFSNSSVGRQKTI